jgi:hypothetical protein
MHIIIRSVWQTKKSVREAVEENMHIIIKLSIAIFSTQNKMKVHTPHIFIRLMQSIFCYCYCTPAFMEESVSFCYLCTVMEDICRTCVTCYSHLCSCVFEH